MSDASSNAIIAMFFVVLMLKTVEVGLLAFEECTNRLHWRYYVILAAIVNSHVHFSLHCLECFRHLVYMAVMLANLITFGEDTRESYFFLASLGGWELASEFSRLAINVVSTKCSFALHKHLYSFGLYLLPFCISLAQDLHEDRQQCNRSIRLITEK